MQSNRKTPPNGKVQPRACRAEITAKLKSTPQGQALIELLAMHPSRKELADAMGASLSYISLCVRTGQISKSGAILADVAGLMKKEKLRPDISAADWLIKPVGLPIGGKHEMNKDQQVLLRDLAAHFGSVKAFCWAAKVQIRSFHGWKTRNRISSHGLVKLYSMEGLSRDLQQRIKALWK